MVDWVVVEEEEEEEAVAQAVIEIMATVAVEEEKIHRTSFSSTTLPSGQLLLS